MKEYAMKITTITLNPAIDLHLYTETLDIGAENFAFAHERSAGGKGLNVSRALASGGYDSDAYVFLGKDNADAFEAMLVNAKTKYTAVYYDGKVRENTTIHQKNGFETRISVDCTGPTEDVLAQFERGLNDICGDGDTVVFAGRFPTGIAHARIVEFLMKIKNTGSRLVVDSSSITSCDVSLVAPYFIKPNSSEASRMLGKNVVDVADGAEAARALCSLGAKCAMISLGALGAVMAADGEVLYAAAPKVNVSSTIGAGDAAVAGAISAAFDGDGAREALRRAVAFGSAACISSGTNPPCRDDIYKLYKCIKILKI